MRTIQRNVSFISRTGKTCIMIVDFFLQILNTTIMSMDNIHDNKDYCALKIHLHTTVFQVPADKTKGRVGASPRLV